MELKKKMFKKSANNLLKLVGRADFHVSMPLALKNVGVWM
jgi:hypothetical protein